MDYVDELAEYLDKKYSIDTVTCQAFTKDGMTAEARHLANLMYEQAFGAIHFMVDMLNKNNCPNEANKILALWNENYHIKFCDLKYRW